MSFNNMVELSSRTSSSISYDRNFHDGFSIEDSFEFYPRKSAAELPEKLDSSIKDIHKKETSDYVFPNDSE